MTSLPSSLQRSSTLSLSPRVCVGAMEVEMTKGKPAKKRGNSCRSSHLKNAKTPEKILPTKTLSQIKTKATSAGATTTQQPLKIRRQVPPQFLKAAP